MAGPVAGGYTTPRANQVPIKSPHSSVNKSLNLHPGDRAHTEVPSAAGYLQTEPEVIYETLNSSRVAEQENASASTSLRNSEIRKAISPSPKKTTPTSSTINTNPEPSKATAKK